MQANKVSGINGSEVRERDVPFVTSSRPTSWVARYEKVRTDFSNSRLKANFLSLMDDRNRIAERGTRGGKKILPRAPVFIPLLDLGLREIVNDPDRNIPSQIQQLKA